MTTTSSLLGPDRLIWLPLLALMAVALIADQARANLHAEARATAAAPVASDDARAAEGWCCPPLDALAGDQAPRSDRRYGRLEPSSAFGRKLPVSRPLPAGRRTCSADASL